MRIAPDSGAGGAVIRARRRSSAALNEPSAAAGAAPPTVRRAQARAAGRVLSRERLMAEVWDEHWFGSTKTLDIHVWALRRKLDQPDRPSRISTIRGVGYRLENP